MRAKCKIEFKGFNMPQRTFEDLTKGRHNTRQHCFASEDLAPHTYWHGKEHCVTAATATHCTCCLYASFSTGLQPAWSACLTFTFCGKRHQHWGDFLNPQKCSAKNA